jgi:hypothetical protein
VPVWQSALMNHVRRLDWRHWLVATRHPARKDGAIAVAWFVLPWVIALALALLHHLGTAAVTILASVSVGLARRVAGVGAGPERQQN